MTHNGNQCVITGAGFATPLGSTRESICASFREKRTPFSECQEFPQYAKAAVRDMGDDAAFSFLSTWRHRRYLNRGAFLCVLAGLRALQDADLTTPPQDMSIIGTAAPALDFGREKTLPPDDGSGLDALWLLRWLPNTAVSVLAALLNVHGPGFTVGCACASSLSALGEGYLRIQAGLADTVLAAAGDSRISSGGILGYAKAGTLSRGFTPGSASRPFAKDRTGFVAGEGAAAFLLESRRHAEKRGARILATITGFAATMDAGSLTAPDPSGTYAEQAVRRALATAALEPQAVRWISAHGTGTALNDSMEQELIARVFPHRPPVTALKSWTGHCASACGAVETALLLAAHTDDSFPPVRNLSDAAHTGINLVTETGHRFPDGPGIVENFGFGGQNAALVLELPS